MKPPIDRTVEIAGFLTQHGWDDAGQRAFDADFSPRRYARLTKADGKTALLMDADANQKTPEFVVVAGLLRQVGLSAPAIIAANPGAGLLLLEDFGDRNMGAAIDGGGALLPSLQRAVQVLVHLHKNFHADMASGLALSLPVFDAARFADQVMLFLDSYYPLRHGVDADDECRQDFHEAWDAVLTRLPSLPRSLLLRDYMLDNLMDLPDRHGLRQNVQMGVQSIGILDFQDAGIGPVAYDLASLAESVRRDVPLETLDFVVNTYHTEMKPDYTLADLRRAVRTLSLQRHVRVMGVVARLALASGRRDKLAYLPRIRAHIAGLLVDISLRPVAAWFNRYNPLHDDDKTF